MNAKAHLTCKYCNEIYKDPINLTCCGDNLCKSHIKEITSKSSSNKFTCPLCQEENKSQHLRVNKLIQNLIENNLHKFELDSKFLKVYGSLKAQIGKLETILKDPENLIYEEIAELKRQVDLDREQLKSQIDELANNLIQQLDSFNSRFKSEYKKNVDFEHYNGLVDSSKKQLNEYEQCLNLFSTNYNERKEKSAKCEEIINNLQPQILKLQNQLLSTKLIYERKNTEHIFGELIIKVIKISGTSKINLAKLIYIILFRMLEKNF